MEASTTTDLIERLQPNPAQALGSNERVTGAMRLLTAMVRNGLRPQGLLAAAALAVELDRPLKDRAENDKYDERAA